MIVVREDIRDLWADWLAYEMDCRFFGVDPNERPPLRFIAHDDALLRERYEDFKCRLARAIERRRGR